MKAKKTRLMIVILALFCLLASILYLLNKGDFDLQALQGEQKYQITYTDAFDTVTTLVAYEDSQEGFDENVRLLHEKLVEYHQLFDIYHNYEGVNNVKTINDEAGKEPVKVQEPIMELLILAKEMYDETDGATNVAFGSVLSLWHEAREEGMSHPESAFLPEKVLLEDAADYIDFSHVILDKKEMTVYLDDKNVSLDVGSIAKGYAAQKIADYAKEELGMTKALINLGGNVVSIGEKATEEPWAVGIIDPDNTEEYIASVEVKNGECVVTSGDYQRYYEVDGKRYCHIIDPTTLYPSTKYRSVTIITTDSGIADALSTGLFVMDLEKGKALIQSLDGVEAMWILPDGTIEYSEGFQHYLGKPIG